MGFLKQFWLENWIECRINRKLVYLIFIVYGAWWVKNYYYLQGAKDMYRYMQNQVSETPTAAPDGEPGKMGSMWNPNI